VESFISTWPPQVFSCFQAISFSQPVSWLNPACYSSLLPAAIAAAAAAAAAALKRLSLPALIDQECFYPQKSCRQLTMLTPSLMRVSRLHSLSLSCALSRFLLLPSLLIALSMCVLVSPLFLRIELGGPKLTYIQTTTSRRRGPCFLFFCCGAVLVALIVAVVSLAIEHVELVGSV
jgi:hypothetical protein